MGAPTDYIAFYPLKTDVNDDTGNYDGINNGVTFDSQSGYFDGNDYVSIPTMGGFNAYTISLWFKNDGTVNYGHLFTSNNQDDFAFKYYVDYKSVYIYTAAAGSKITPDNSAPAQDMTHLVATCDGATLKIYIDSIEVLSVAFSTQLPVTSYKIGNYNTEYTIGYEARVRIYDYKLTEQEVIDIYNEEYEEFYPPVWQSFLDISEDIAMVSESFLDVSQDELPTYQTFQDISIDDILTTEIFQDLSADHQGRIEIFTDVSINQGDIAWGRFYDISEDIPESYSATGIKRINE